MTRPRLSEVARLFLRVGVTVFGGGDPTIAVLQREFYRRDWLTSDQFAIAFGLARLTPGTNVLAFCAASAWYLLGAVGAVTAVLAATIPASVLVVWITEVYELSKRYALATAVVNAVVAAAVGTMIGAAFLLVRTQTSRTRWLRPVVITAGAFLLPFVGLSPLRIILAAALVGFFWVDA